MWTERMVAGLWTATLVKDPTLPVSNVNFAPLNLELPRLITGILEDGSGHLWLGSNQGLYRAERRQLTDTLRRLQDNLAAIITES